MKICSKCKTAKQLSEFAVNKTKADGRSFDCKTCKKAYNKDYYVRNYDQERVRLQKRKDEQKAKIAEFLNTVKVKCSKCPETRIAALDFHHKDPSEKEFSISFALANGFDLERVKREISKCEVICSNCHRVEHWEMM